MTGSARRGPIVIDTGVYGASLIPRSTLAAAYETVLVGRPAFVSFQTAAELRYGALLRGWGPSRMQALDARISQAVVSTQGPN